MSATHTGPPLPTIDGAPPSFHLLAKPTGATCNLDCGYCFFLSKEMLYPGSRFRMADELLQQYLRQFIESHAAAPEVTIAWQGGEPTLMGLDFFRRAVAIAERFARPGQQLVHTIQTNGTRLDDDWCAFLSEKRFLVGLSVDGPRSIHDAYRVDKAGRGSFDDVMRGWRSLVDHGVDVNILCTVNDQNATRGRDIYRFFRDELHAQHIQFIPIVERTTEDGEPASGDRPDEAQPSWSARPLYTQSGSNVTSRSVRPEQWGQFLVDIFEQWVRHDIGRVYVQLFDVALANWVGAPPGLCVHAETCGLALALEHNGDLYCCDHFVEPEYRLGNIQQTHMLELISSPRQREFGLAKRDTLPRDCRECDVRFACHGGCPKDRFTSTLEGEPGLNYLCAGYKRFFHHITPTMTFMAQQLRRGGAPAEAMRLHTDADTTRPRNSPCPCGSGRKWKRCHGDRSPTSSSAP
ncbi:MAG: anaerobic sulfatase maturase, partial [Dehalococcoidia bacterium]|nr:anaerobic sulfatase maturase [Dehalococcoidia bacterium]